MKLTLRLAALGLAVARRVAESHGGTVTVRSPWTEDGKGTAFELRLPKKPPGYKPAAAPRQA